MLFVEWCNLLFIHDTMHIAIANVAKKGTTAFAPFALAHSKQALAQVIAFDMEL